MSVLMPHATITTTTTYDIPTPTPTSHTPPQAQRAMKRYKRACLSFDDHLDVLHSLLSLMSANRTPHPHAHLLRNAANYAMYADAGATCSLFLDRAEVSRAIRCYRDYARQARSAAAYERVRARRLGEWEGRETGAQLIEEAGRRAEVLARRLKQLGAACRGNKHGV